MSLNFVREKIGASLVALECRFIITPKRKIYKIEYIFSFSLLFFSLNPSNYICPEL